MEILKKLPRAGENPDTVILADGDYPSAGIAASMLEGASRVVCCDGAAVEFTRRGGRPYAVVGDCDSLPAELRHRYTAILHCDPDQETNDLTKAVHFCVKEGFGDLVILGATGKREDHTIGNIGLMADYGDIPQFDNVRMITGQGIIEIISGDTVFESFTGERVSIFCPDPAVEVTTVDLLYPLRNAHLTAWWQGTLNQALKERFGLNVTGKTIVYRFFDNEDIQG